MEAETKKKIYIGLGVFAVAATMFAVWYKKVFLKQPPTPDKLSATFNPNQFLSPASGTVVAVRSFNSNDFIENKHGTEDNIEGAVKLFAGDVDTSGTIISIHMGLDDIHFQVCPMAATVSKIDYVKGNHKNAISKGADGVIRYENEHCSYLFETSDGIKYRVVQIAGLLARRIESYVKVGQRVDTGYKIGIINLGSQTTVILPSNITCSVNVGDKVLVGATVMGMVNP